MNKITKQCVAAVASLAMAGTLCVAGAVVAGSSAWAAQTACDASKAPWDTNQTKNCVGSIEIDKYKDEVDSKGAQKKQTGVVGAKFRVTPVKKINGTDIDLKKSEDWLTLAAKVPTLNANPGSLAQTDLGTAISDNSNTDNDKTLFATGNDGKVTISNLPIGLYKVEEVVAAPDYSNDVAPFFMTVPEITRDEKSKDNTYTYNVKVEPKNAYIKDNVTKTADTTKTVGSGDEITYTIKAKLNKTKATNGGNNLTKDDLQDFAIYDDVQTAAYQNVSDAIINEVKINGEKSAMTKTTDYTVSHEDSTSTNGIEAGRTRYKVTFTASGLQAIATKANTLNAEPVEIDVTVKFTLAKDLSSFIAKGLKNESGFIPGHGKGINPKPTPGGSETTKFVKFQIKKVNGTDGTTTLPGAKFAIFASEAEAKACAADPTRSAKNCDDKSAKGFANAANGTGDNGIATGVTTGTGTFTVKVTNAQEPFYVVETAAPKNFALSPIVEKVVARNTADPTTGSTDGGHYDADTTTFTYTFKDVPTKDDGSWFKLPKTGAAGVIIFALIGLGLVGSGMFVFLKNRKKEEEQAA